MHQTALSLSPRLGAPDSSVRVCTFRERRESASGHFATAARKVSSIRLSMWARASASRWFRHLFQAWKAPWRPVCFRRRRATVCSSFAVRYLHGRARTSAFKPPALLTFAVQLCQDIGMGGGSSDSLRCTESHLCLPRQDEQSQSYCLEDRFLSLLLSKLGMRRSLHVDC